MYQQSEQSVLITEFDRICVHCALQIHVLVLARPVNMCLCGWHIEKMGARTHKYTREQLSYYTDESTDERRVRPRQESTRNSTSRRLTCGAACAHTRRDEHAHLYAAARARSSVDEPHTSNLQIEIRALELRRHRSGLHGRPQL